MSKAKFPKLLYVWEEKGSDESWKSTADDLLDLPDRDGEQIATYVLDKVQRLQITRTLKLK